MTASVPARIRLVTPNLTCRIPHSALRILHFFRWAEVRRLSLQNERGGLLTVREPLDENPVSRVRFPLAKPRICGATCPSKTVQSRECKVESGCVWAVFILHSALLTRHFFWRAVEFGLSVKRDIASGFKPRPSRQYGWVPSSLLARQLFGSGRCTSVIEPVAQQRESIPCEWKDTGSSPVRNIEVVCPSNFPSHLPGMTGESRRLRFAP